jgi:shikimate dehydrogenase
MMVKQDYLDRITGVFGQPVSENPGVVIQQAAYQDLGLTNWRFLTIDVEPTSLADAIAGMRAMGFKGVNLMIRTKSPFWSIWMRFLKNAKLIGAVNTIVVNDGVLFGENTDGKGFMESLKNSEVDPAGKTISVLGAGGAARAICVELAVAGAKHMNIVNIPQDRGMADSLVSLLNERTEATAEHVEWVSDYCVPEDVDILVNATPIGLYPNVHDIPPVDFQTIRPDLFVQDVIPNPAFTPFLKKAGERGAKWQSGMGCSSIKRLSILKFGPE